MRALRLSRPDGKGPTVKNGVPQPSAPSQPPLSGESSPGREPVAGDVADARAPRSREAPTGLPQRPRSRKGGRAPSRLAPRTARWLPRSPRPLLAGLRLGPSDDLAERVEEGLGLRGRFRGLPVFRSSIWKNGPRP